MMDLKQLAMILRENGDKVLNGFSKLSLSTKLLKDLNDSFSLIIEEREALSSTFQVITNSNSRVELLLDLEFLHDFIQRTIGLKLVDDFSDSCDFVNINKFKNLKLLETRKIPLNRISGLQSLRNQLQYIICIRSLSSLNELFVTCGADQTQAFIWNELKEAILSYNCIETLDNSLEYVPWLQVLDLSHNSITNAQALECLANLKYLNLGFNYLDAVPMFKKEMSRKLQVLILKGNFIRNLTGLSNLDNLGTLDLSCNLLIDRECLDSLPHLAALHWLNLEGNPLSFNSNHRTEVAQYLHTNTSTVKFILDRLVLTKAEKLLVGTFCRILNLDKEQNQSSDLTNSIDSIGATSELTRSQNIQRGRKVRDAIISECEESLEIPDQNPIILASSSEHIETQRKLESLRNQYGTEWLRKQSGSLVQDILGMEKSTASKLSSTPYDEDFLTHAAHIFANNSDSDQQSQRADIEQTVPAAEKSETNTFTTGNNTFVTANNTFLTETESSIFEDADSVIMSVSPSDSSDEDPLEDGEEHLYLAKIDKQEIFLVLTHKYIKERDLSSGRTRAKWLLEMVQSCELFSSNPALVRLEFDTVRRNLKQREYVLEEDEGQKLLRAINQITSNRSLKELNQTVFNCMKCSTQFSQVQEISLVKKVLPTCPTCGSTIVYENEEDLTPTNHLQSLNGHDTVIGRAQSPSECSIASETENNIAQFHVMADVHMDSNISSNTTANCSAESVQESNSSHITLDNLLLRRYESDIEVISNPSQSSIEVLDDHMRPGRKKSSEERKPLNAISLETIPDVIVPLTTPLLAGLTESSSSSSFTESVCTAYDTHTHISRPASGLEVRPTIPEETEPKANLISSLFEGLFVGATAGIKSLDIDSAKRQPQIWFNFNENFSNVDHRIKYHLYQNIFEDENEQFLWILKCFVLNTNLVKPVDSCLVLSTHRVYILVIKENKIGDEISDWLLKKESYTIDRLQTIFSLPWKQGIGLEIRTVGKTINHLCLLQDMQRTTSFLSFLNENPLPDSCDLVCTSTEQSMLNLQQLLLSDSTDLTNADTNLCILSIFNKCTTIKAEKQTVTSFGVFLVTASDLILLNDINWLLPDTNNEPNIFTSQPISNLLEVVLDDLTIEFHFLDEIASCEEIWAISWETADTLTTVVSAVKSPWEAIFSVPLQVNHKIHSG